MFSAGMLFMALKKFLMVAVVAALFVACGDDDGSFATRPSGDSSSACEDCDGSSSSKAKSSSSSSVTPKSSDSETSVSSSSVKSSSSVTSSSSAKEVILSSSEGSSDSKSSSSEKAESSSSKAIEPAEGTLTDTRDGKTYKTVTIGTQTWMAENLNYAYTGVPYKYTYIDSSYTSDSTSWCYGDSLANCTKYGRLYTWAAAMDSVGTWSTNGKGCGYGKVCSPTYPVRGICPEGWHLPDTTEWHTLFTAVGGKSTAGKMLKSTSGWYDHKGGDDNGTDAYAFSALPAGYRYYDGYIYLEGSDADFWSSTEDDSSYAYRMNLYYGYDNANLNRKNKNLGFSVRCVKD